jgi:galactokinase
VAREYCSGFTEKVQTSYKKAAGLEATILVSEPAEGASEITAGGRTAA